MVKSPAWRHQLPLKSRPRPLRKHWRFDDHPEIHANKELHPWGYTPPNRHSKRTEASRRHGKSSRNDMAAATKSIALPPAEHRKHFQRHVPPAK